MFNLPGVVLASILCLVAVQGLRSLAPDDLGLDLLLDLAVIPAQWTLSFDPSALPGVLRQAVGGASSGEAVGRIAFARAVLENGGPHYWSAATYALLHGSWPHVLMNSVWLAAFGTPVARRCGPLRFLLLALAAALGGAAVHVLAHPLSVAPMIGASAAVSGMMGAAVRFVFTPTSFVPDRSGGMRAHQSGLSLIGLMRNSRAMLFLGIWFATNILFAMIAAPLGLLEGEIAWEAHIGGFVTGLLLFPVIDRDRPGGAT